MLVQGKPSYISKRARRNLTTLSYFLIVLLNCGENLYTCVFGID